MHAVAVVHYYSLRELKLGTKPKFKYPNEQVHSTYEQPEYTRNVLGRDFVPTHFTLNKLINLSYIRKVEWIRSLCLGGHGHVLTSIKVWVLRETLYVLHQT